MICVFFTHLLTPQVTEMTNYYKEQVGKDLPNEMWHELEDLKKRVATQL